MNTDDRRVRDARLRVAEATAALDGALPTAAEVESLFAAVFAGKALPSDTVRELLAYAVGDLVYVLAKLEDADNRLEAAWQVIYELESKVA